MYKSKRGLWMQQVTIDGKRKVFSSKSKKELLLKIATYQNDKKKKKVTVREIADPWLEDIEKKVTYNSMKGYRAAYKRICSVWGETPIEDITAQDILTWINSFNLAHKTIKNILLVFREIYNYGYINNGIRENPILHLKAPKGKGKKEREFPSEEDIQIVNKNVDLPFGLMAYMALYTGLRRGELLALTWKDIDFNKKLIHVNKSIYFTTDHIPHIKEPKTVSGIREVPLMDSLYEILLPLKGRSNEHIFGDLHEYQIDKGLREYREKTGLSCTLHGLRHGFASILYKNNIDIKTAAYVLGHAQSSTTLEIYTHLMEKDKLKSVRDALNQI